MPPEGVQQVRDMGERVRGRHDIELARAQDLPRDILTERKVDQLVVTCPMVTSDVTWVNSDASPGTRPRATTARGEVRRALGGYPDRALSMAWKRTAQGRAAISI